MLREFQNMERIMRQNLPVILMEEGLANSFIVILSCCYLSQAGLPLAVDLNYFLSVYSSITNSLLFVLD
jgi:hypothetical protein